ncbi:hypothetical protein BDV38DRAFT_296798 [Aspergillus pseudotamarii]|uniref:Xylanolytic transcriptional activator regulatory domain-containing protein n=1 Tax=Aspergillus pseudotamarii TaxID=132259 RepID=A0A5N6T4N4_ASPPS|nr:uncharacterized protein BDV38DRAFT_296798 [Aspergillus pseudotamarii]KAE8141267.1 hypothetical protein BDV38DRAFT_296798 [Aspergillus pseudotamarii]
MSGNLTFVSYHDMSDRSRRIRLRRACNECRRRKRRCNHQLRTSSGGSSSPSHNLVWTESQTVSQTNDSGAGSRIQWTNAQELSPSPSSRPVQGEQDQPSPHRPEEPEQQRQRQQNQTQESLRLDAHASPHTTRFVGDLNPEARLLGETTTPEDAQEMAPGEVGVWVQPRRSSKCAPGGEGLPQAGAAVISPSRNSKRSHPPVSDILPHRTIKALSDIYFANIHPMIPLLDEAEYWQQMSRGTIPSPLVHVVCLLAAKDNTAGQHLKLIQSRDAVVPVREFCCQLYVSLSTVLSRRTTLEKTTLIRILGLLSLHQEGNEGMDESSSCIAQAMHSAQSLALHLPRPNDVRNELRRIFWCLWILDRLNAATNSRPCVMADIDIAVPDLTPEESGSVAFDVCFRIAKILNQVIALYRPTAKDPASGWDTDFPGFEQVMDEMHAWQLSSSTIATLHIFYLATAILAHRLKTITTLPSPTPARLRQQLSAIQVIRYMQDSDRLDALHPFPVVVYAASLALSVSYQQLRYSRLPGEQEDARHDFNTGCDILQELRLKWVSADAMASLAHRISAALDQLPSLDVLRINRSDIAERDNTLTDRQGMTGDVVEGADSQSSADVPMANRPTDFQATQPHLETMDLFSGMDDVSWMYLDAENPVSFDVFPLMNFEAPYTSW